jgi:transcriptional regulator with XRE-family HTH domain
MNAERRCTMMDMNMMIASNILAILKQQNRKQTDLAEALQTNKQTVNKMLNGSRMIHAIELKRISDFLGVSMEDLTRIPEEAVDTDMVHAFMGKVDSEQAKTALDIADKLSDMILFHSRVRENGTAMMEAWDE